MENFYTYSNRFPIIFKLDDRGNIVPFDYKPTEIPFGS